MKQHPYAEVLRAIADGHEMEYRADAQDRWVACSHQNTLKMLSFEHSAMPTPEQFRIKPRTIRIGEVDVPEPIREDPTQRVTFWAVQLGESNFPQQCSWSGSHEDWELLKKGLAHWTEDGAAAHIKALLAFTAH